MDRTELYLTIGIIFIIIIIIIMAILVTFNSLDYIKEKESFCNKKGGEIYPRGVQEKCLIGDKSYYIEKINNKWRLVE